MRYELINPSDQIFLTANSLTEAGAACMLLSSWYGLKGNDGSSFPIMADEKWFESNGIKDLRQFIYDHRENIAVVLESCTYAHKRSSLNNIGKTAKAIASKIRKLTPDWVKAAK